MIMMQMMLTSLQVSCCLPSPLHSPQGSRPPPSAFGAVHSLVMKKGIMIVIIMMIMVIISKENYHDDCDESKKRVSSKKNTWFSLWFLQHKFCCILPTDSIHPSFQTCWMSFSNIFVYKYDLLQGDQVQLWLVISLWQELERRKIIKPNNFCQPYI